MKIQQIFCKSCCKMLQNVAKSAIFANNYYFQKTQLDNLVDFEKCCKTHIYLQRSVPMQPKTSNILPKFRRSAGRPSPTTRTSRWPGAAGALAGADVERDVQRPIGKISAKCCSFSAASAPIFSRKYAFCSIFQNLPDYQTEFFEIWQKFANFATFAKLLLNFHKNC